MALLEQGPAALPPAPARRRTARLLADRRVQGLLFGAAAVLGSLLIALALVDPRFQPLILPPLAAGCLALVFRFPLAATTVVLLLVMSVLSSGTFKVPAGPAELRLEEIVIGALLLVSLLRPRRNWWGGAAGGALAAFFAVVALSAVLAMSLGRVEFGDAYHYSRQFAPLLLFFVIVRMFPEREQVRRLLLIAAVIAGVAGFVSLTVAAPGSPMGEILNPGDSASIRDKEGLGLVNRVRLPGVHLAYVIFWYAAWRAMSPQETRRTLWLVLLAGMSISLVLSFNRNMWLGLAIGLVVMLVLSREHARRQLVIGLLLLVVGGAFVALSGVRVTNDSPLYPIVERGTTLFDPAREARDSSLTDRFLENRYALAALAERPLTGVGPGAQFGLAGTAPAENGQRVRVFSRFVHNQYLHLLLIGGPLALATFLVFLLAPLKRIGGRLQRDDELLTLAIGVGISMISAIVMISFVHATSAAVLGLLVGVITVLAGRPHEAQEHRGDALGTARA